MKTYYSFRNTLMLLIFLSFLPDTAKSQVIVNIEQPQLNQLNAEDMWNIQLTNTTQNVLAVFLKGTITNDVDGVILNASCDPFELKPGFVRIKFNNLVNIRVDYNKNYEESFIRTGKVPEGMYEICVKVIATNDNSEIGEGCITQNVLQLNPPEIISPESGKNISELEAANILFQWHPSLPAGSNYSYTLKIVEVNPGQTPETALENNPVWYQKEGILTTVFQYPLNAPKLTGGKTFAWRIIMNKNGEQTGPPSEGAVVVVFTSEDEEEDLSVIPPIELLTPTDNSIITAQVDPETDEPLLNYSLNKTKFSWKSPKPKPKGKCTYTFKMVEINNDQTADEAMVSNNPIFVEDEIGGELFGESDDIVFLYPEYNPLQAHPTIPNNERKFAWKVELKNENGKIIGESGVRAIIIFVSSSGNEQSLLSSPRLVSPLNNETINISKTNPQIELKWEAPNKKPDGEFTYSIKVALAKMGQSPAEAIVNNNPIIDQSGIAGTEFGVLRMDVSTFNSTDAYIPAEANRDNRTIFKPVWQVSMVDKNGSIIGNPSEVSTFLIAFSTGE